MNENSEFEVEQKYREASLNFYQKYKPTVYEIYKNRNNSRDNNNLILMATSSSMNNLEKEQNLQIKQEYVAQQHNLSKLELHKLKKFQLNVLIKKKELNYEQALFLEEFQADAMIEFNLSFEQVTCRDFNKHSYNAMSQMKLTYQQSLTIKQYFQVRGMSTLKLSFAEVTNENFTEEVFKEKENKVRCHKEQNNNKKNPSLFFPNKVNNKRKNEERIEDDSAKANEEAHKSKKMKK